MVLTRYPYKSVSPNRVLIPGQFGFCTVAEYASYTLAVASGTNITITADSSGTGGNDLDFQATADGNAKASCTITFGTDTLAISHNDAGTAKNGLVVTLVPGGTAGSEVATEDASGNLLVSYQASTSTTTQVAAAINGHANWVCPTTGTQTATGVLSGTTSGGTAATWAEESGTPTKLHLHFTDASTDVDAAVAALNGASSVMTASGSGSHTLASGDAVAKQDLSGGVDAVAFDDDSVEGEGFSVARSGAAGVGEYTVTLDRHYDKLFCADATLQLSSAADQYVLAGTYDSSAKTIKFTVWDKSAGAAGDPTQGANKRIHFLLICEN